MTIYNQYHKAMYLGVTATADFVETLTYAERIQLRQQLAAAGCNQLVRNLYYDYTKQCWIEGADFPKAGAQ